MASRTPVVAVVDDDPFVLKALRRLLRSAGLDVDTYASGTEFLDAKRTCEPDCLVLDLHMPELSGFDVQDELSANGSKVPIIVITGHDTDEARSRVIAHGAKAYLCKPVDEATLIGAINSAIGPMK